MKSFLNEDFLLESKSAQKLYHDYAAKMPIIDYHNHLPPDEIAVDKKFENITDIWLKGDHYKWRAMRANGVNENFITGDASDKEKFLKWAATVPYTMRNPLYHWTHLELQRYFGINEVLNAKSGAAIYEESSAKIQTADFSTQNLLRRMNVKVVCTTDEPTDSLVHHQALNKKDWGIKMLPGFRPDKLILIENPVFLEMIKKLEACTNININNLNDLLAALENRIEFFHSLGGRLSDHGLNQLYASDFTFAEVNQILQKRLAGKTIYAGEAIQYQSAILYYLAKMYHAKDWVMQFHLGALRNNNQRLLNKLGADVGCDSIGDFSQAVALSRFLNRLDTEEKLCKTILYNLNPADNEVFATMVGNYNDGNIAGKMQWGSGWWFLDQKDGMEKQMNTLSNMGLLSRFVGMLTDSRSFLSFPRHEYFRRILCNLIGRDIENGELPNDIAWLGQMVEDICYNNAKTYFNFE
jgi:glucuronate isomerase